MKKVGPIVGQNIHVTNLTNVSGNKEVKTILLIQNTNVESNTHYRHQHNTDDTGQALGEQLRYVQMSR